MPAGPELALTVRGPFRLPAVAVSHGWFQTAPFAWHSADGRLERVEALGGGAVTLAMRQRGGGVVVTPSARLEGAARAAASARVTRVLQLDADLDGFADAARAVDPALADDLLAFGAGRVLAGASLFEDVVKSLCGTNTTWRHAVACINRIGQIGHDGAFPDPADILRAGEDHLREVCRVGYRAPAVIAAARSAIDGTLGEIEADSAAGDGERVFAGLSGLAGVGPASAGFVILLMGHFERPSIDAAALRAAGTAWFDGRRPTARELMRRIEPAGPYRGLVLAWATLRSWQRAAGIAAA